MKTKNQLSRRSLIKAASVGIGFGMVGCTSMGTKKGNISFNNSDFYYSDGKFNPDAAKEGYIRLMKYHGYPVFDGVKENLWVSDYGTGEFTKLGLGALGFINDLKDSYMLQDLFLLPNQMLPEHYHVKTAKAPAKMEGWVVRHGLAYVYGEGEPTPHMHAKVPKCHLNGNVTVKHEVILKPGQSTQLNRKTARHWQFAGPEGTIESEVATYHDNDGVIHSDSNLVFP